MATNQTIKLKRGTSTPTTSNIASGEVAIDTSAQKFYVNDGGTIKEIGGQQTFGVSTMTGDNSDTTLTLSSDPGSENNTQVFIDGVYQPKSSYSVSGTTLTFSTAPPTGTAVEAIVGSSAPASVPSDASVTSAKLSGALTTPSSLTVTDDLAVDTDTLFVDVSTDRVGINTSSPAYELDVDSTIHIGNDAGTGFTHSRMIFDSNGSVRGVGSFMHNQVNDVEWFAGNPYNQTDSFAITRSATASHADATANVTNALVTIDSSGRVGIGTSSPSEELHISASSPRIQLQDSDGTNQYGQVYQGGGTLTLQARNNTGNGSINFETYDGSTTTSRMRIMSGGNVGIGTTGPGQLLDVEGTTDPSIRVASTGTASTDDAIMRIQIGGTSASSYIYFGDSADADVGNLRYNHSSDELSVIIGTVEEFRFASGGTFHADADIVAFSTTVASDAALKYNINPVENALDKLNSLDGVTFQWKRDDKVSAGVIAQDVEKVMPSAVKEVESLRDNSTHKAVDYNQIIALLVEAVKDQQAQIDELKQGR